MAADAKQLGSAFDPTTFGVFRFLSRDLDAHGRVTLHYALDDELLFEEQFELPLAGELGVPERARLDGLLSLLHWVAGVSYFKMAAPLGIAYEGGAPGPAAVALLEALYSEGLGEFAYTNSLPELPRPRFPVDPVKAANGSEERAPARLDRVLVPVGGGKDSAVALEILRRSAGRDVTLFSIGDAPPIARTAAVAGLPHLIARRRLDPKLSELNSLGALNGHIPITAIVSCVALLTAALHGFDAVAMANERSASSGNLSWDGIEVNHQFSKGLRAERLLGDAVAEVQAGEEGQAGVSIFSVLRPASELAIARAFAQMERYHGAFTSCNAIFRLDPALRAASWCCDCPKCRFVFLVLAPFSTPEHLREIFGRDLLDEDGQFEGFALLMASGGHKPFECVGEEQESLAALRLLAEDPRWKDHRMLQRLVTEILPQYSPGAGDTQAMLALSDEHDVPDALMEDVHALLGA
jgi:UDP-N-acetyl-alpha-D-muramoyl-L-alanyl-L-glutamate epimerase